MLDEDDVRVEKLRKFVAVTLRQGEACIVTLRNEHRRAVPAHMHHQNTLLEAPLVGMAPVEGLREHHLVFSGKRAGRQRFGLAHAVERGDAPFDLAVGRPEGEGQRRHKGEAQQSQSFQHSG